MFTVDLLVIYGLAVYAGSRLRACLKRADRDRQADED